VIMENVDPMGYDTAEQYVEECYGQVAPEAMPGLLVEAARIILDNAATAQPQPEGAAEPLRSPETHCESCGRLLVDSRCADCEARYAADEQRRDDDQPGPAAGTEVEPGDGTTPATTLPPTTEPAATPKLTKLTVSELQAKYLEVVGRPTSSSDSAYLVWKIRQAQKGKIPVGPRQGRRAVGEGGDARAAQDHKVLPLRMDTELVAKLDEARERLGLKSRMDLFRRALHSYLAAAGETEVAALFAAEA